MSQHCLTDIPEDKAEDKLRTKYNDLKNKSRSKFFKEYVRPLLVFSVRQRKAMSQEEINQKEVEHVTACLHEEGMLEEERKLIEIIEKREEKRSTTDLNNDERNYMKR